MQLSNSSPLAARATTVPIPGTSALAGHVTAKATFRITPNGLALDTQAPMPIWQHDHPTPTGVLPGEAEPGPLNRLEVLFLGSAYASGDAPTRTRDVSLQVGDNTRRLRVVGDRVWTDDGSPSDPQPFRRMPMTWERAFGGSAHVLIDDESPLQFADARNPYGKGFDVLIPARALCERIKAPEGFPVGPERRALPNLEDPSEPVRTPADVPVPRCWATVPIAMVDPLSTALGRDPDPAPAAGWPRISRAHPDWLIERPPLGAPLLLEGLLPDTDRIELRLPTLRVFVDYMASGYRGTREMPAERMAILGDEHLLYVVYRHTFTLRRKSTDAAMRLRIDLHGGSAT